MQINFVFNWLPISRGYSFSTYTYFHSLARCFQASSFSSILIRPILRHSHSLPSPEIRWVGRGNSNQMKCLDKGRQRLSRTVFRLLHTQNLSLHIVVIILYEWICCGVSYFSSSSFPPRRFPNTLISSHSRQSFIFVLPSPKRERKRRRERKKK